MGNTFGQKLVCCPLPTPTVNKLTWALQKIEGCFRSFMKTLKKRFQIFFSKFNSNLRKFLLYFRKFFGLKNNKNRHLRKRRHNFYSNFFFGQNLYYENKRDMSWSIFQKIVFQNCTPSLLENRFRNIYL
jgi:hypothetical protein